MRHEDGHVTNQADFNIQQRFVICVGSMNREHIRLAHKLLIIV